MRGATPATLPTAQARSPAKSPQKVVFTPRFVRPHARFFLGGLVENAGLAGKIGGTSPGRKLDFKHGVPVMPFRNDDLFQDSDISDPLRIERSSPMDDEEAAAVEALCLAATPGPLMADEAADGQGILVASLPDGRHIISLTSEGCQSDAQCMAEANIQLICRARYLLLRMLRDRRQWLDRIQELEGLLEPGPARKAPAYPR